MERDTLLGENREEGVVRIVQEGGGEESASGGNERRRGPLGLLALDEAVLENAGRMSHLSGGIGVDIDVVEIFITSEEFLPEGSEVDVGVGEKKKSDLELRVGGAKMGEGAGEIGGRGGSGIEGSGAAEEGQIIGLVGKGNGEMAGRDDAGGQKKKHRN